MTITKNWLIDKGFLFSTKFWGEKKVFVAERYFPGKKLRIFMTGDGHKKPPFKWTSEKCWANYLKDFIQKNKICCHVELVQKDVEKKKSEELVPAALSSVCGNGKVFGWEPKVAKYVKNVMDVFADLDNMKKKFRESDMIKAYKSMLQVSSLGYLHEECKEAKVLIEKYHKEKNLDKNPWRDLFIKYHDNQYKMRVTSKFQSEIGKKIQEKINRYKDHVHLIACGADHLRIHPLYKYVKPPTGFFGIADESNG